MKKQKKLNLGKIKVAGINGINSIVGGVPTSRYCQTYEPECLTELCDTGVGGSCATTVKTRANSDVCGSNMPSEQAGEIC